MLRVWRTEPGDRVAVMVPARNRCPVCDTAVPRPVDPSRTGTVMKVGRKWLYVHMDGSIFPTTLRKFAIHGTEGFDPHVPELRKSLRPNVKYKF